MSLNQPIEKQRRRKRQKKIKTVKIYREVKLTKDELNAERKQLLDAEDYVNAILKCQKCIITFPNLDDFKDHMSLKHELVSFNYHTSRHWIRYECTSCSIKCANKREALKHYQLHCDRIYSKHTYEDQIHEQHSMLSTPDNDQTVMVQMETERNCKRAEFACDICNKTFRWKTSLRKHQEAHRIQNGQKRRPYCEPCRLSFTNTYNLQKHVRTSSKHQIQLKLWKVQQSSDTPDSEALVKEITCSVNSAREQFACPQCDKRFQWRGNLLRHLHSHAARAKGELVCVPCNRSFSSIATFKQHMKISRKHVSEEHYQHICKECGQKFVNKTRLKDHVDWEHLKNFVHTCPVCQKAFKSHTSLYLHKQVVHNKESSQHLCNHCGRAFPNHTKLRCHITALHTRECPYKCKLCSARFGWHSCLSRHLKRVHKPT